MPIDTTIFKNYDIRGVYPTSVNEDVAYKIGQAYAKLLQTENPGKSLKIIVSGDMRISTPFLREKLTQGLLDSGISVVDIGLSSTPTFYFAVGFYGYDGGIQVSASHNPKEYNGFKMVRAKGVPVSGDTGIYTIRDMVVKNEFEVSETKGTLEKKEGVTKDLVSKELEGIDVSLIKPFKIVVDAANAMGALDVEAMFEEIPGNLIKLNFELDGTFPVHQADPLDEENLEYTKKAVLENNADLGISIDGDGDRYFLIDEKGQTVRQEILRGIMAQVAVHEHPGATVCYDIRPGRITRDMIEEVGGHASVTKVGHSLIKEQMLKENAVFGGESSGHYFYKFDFGTFEAPTSLISRFLIWLTQQEKPLSEAIAPYKKYFHSGEVNLKVEDKIGKMKLVAEKYSDGDINYLDGVSIEYPDYWFNVRPSNTEPLLRLSLEAKSKKLMEQKRDEIKALLEGNNA